jgi:hypothetical protein
MHNRLVRFILEIAVPTTSEVWCRPSLHLSKLILSWANLHTCIDAIRSKGTSTLDVPFVKDLLLNFWNTTDEVVKTLSTCERSY